jgi:1-deoxy-D-xylulose-5-phosphate synthase
MTLMSPKDENELRHMLFTATNLGSPAAVRYPRGNGVGVALDEPLRSLPIGKGEVVQRGTDALIICFGPIIQNALVAAEELASKHSISCTIINARFAKPLDEELLRRELPNYDIVCTLEDHAIAGGFGSAVVEFANDEDINLRCSIKRFGVTDTFVPHGTQAEQHAMNGYDARSISRFILENAQARKKVA